MTTDANPGSQQQMIKTPNLPARNASPHVHILAAGTAAIISTVAVQPLDVLKTRLQVSSILRHQSDEIKGIARNLQYLFLSEGAKGLYRGVLPSLLSVVPSISIYFTLYNECKRAMGGFPHDGSPAKVALVQSLSAGIAACSTAVITNPLWVVKTRMQIQTHSSILPPKYHDTLHTVRSIVAEEGVRGLYKGLSASFFNASQAMVQFPLYEALKTRMCHVAEPNQQAFCFLASSSIAACFASLITYPTEVVRSRMQIQGIELKILNKTGRAGPRAYKGIFDAFRTIWREEGTRGLYRGFRTNLVRLVPAQAIAFTVYELILKLTSSTTK
jgi:solute carrier family 25 folate transporter 32